MTLTVTAFVVLGIVGALCLLGLVIGVMIVAGATKSWWNE